MFLPLSRSDYPQDLQSPKQYPDQTGALFSARESISCRAEHYADSLRPFLGFITYPNRHYK